MIDKLKLADKILTKWLNNLLGCNNQEWQAEQERELAEREENE